MGARKQRLTPTHPPTHTHALLPRLQVGARKQREMFKLGFYLLTFVLAIYK